MDPEWVCVSVVIPLFQIMRTHSTSRTSTSRPPSHPSTLEEAHQPNRKFFVCRYVICNANIRDD